MPRRGASRARKRQRARLLAAATHVSRVSARRDLRLVTNIFTLASTSVGSDCGLRHWLWLPSTAADRSTGMKMVWDCRAHRVPVLAVRVRRWEGRTHALQCQRLRDTESESNRGPGRPAAMRLIYYALSARSLTGARAAARAVKHIFFCFNDPSGDDTPTAQAAPIPRGAHRFARLVRLATRGATTRRASALI